MNRLLGLLTAGIFSLGLPLSLSAHNITPQIGLFMNCWMMAIDTPAVHDKVTHLAPEQRKWLMKLSGKMPAQTRACYQRENLLPIDTCQKIVDATLLSSDYDELLQSELNKVITPEDIKWISSKDFDEKAMKCQGIYE